MPATTTEPFRPFAPKPCKECPFRRKAAAGWLGKAPPETFINNINREIPSPCHSTIDYEDPDWHEKWEAGEIGNLCTGALIAASNMCKLARNQSNVPRVEPDYKNVFSNHREFIDHHRASPVQSWNDDDND